MTDQEMQKAVSRQMPDGAGSDDTDASMNDASDARAEGQSSVAVADDPAADPAATADPTGSIEAASMTAEREAAPAPEMSAEAAPAPEPVAEAAPEPAPEMAAQAPEAAPKPDAATAEPEAEPAPEPTAQAPETSPAAAEVEAAPAAVEPEDDGRPEPTTMDELLSGPDADIRSFKHGDVVEGTVVRIDKDEILVDIGAKSEGVVSNRELAGRHAEAPPALKLGDTVLVYVMQPESDEGHAILSLRRAGLERKWRSMQEQFEAGVIIEAPVIDHNKGGLIVDCGIRGFIPISQIVDFPRRPQNDQPRDAAQEIAEKLQPFVGRRLRLKILEVNRKANRLILSEKVALYEERREKRDELFSSLQVGQKVKGVVRSIAPFGVFVDLGGIDGLVHKSELSWNKVNNPETGYKVGDEVEAEVIDINHERGRISLSIRRLQPDPWHSTVADYKVGDVIEGTVTKLVNFGAFVRVRDGLEGLIHISELSQARVTHPSDVVREGQTLKLKIISLDSERHRLGLSLKQAEEAAPAPARPERTERERRPRAQREYSSADAVQESEGGIDNTLAAAFAQVREQMAATEEAQRAAGVVPAGEAPEVAEMTAAPEAEMTAAPEAETAAPEAETAAPEAETAAPETAMEAEAPETAPVAERPETAPAATAAEETPAVEAAAPEATVAEPQAADAEAPARADAATEAGSDSAPATADEPDAAKRAPKGRAGRKSSATATAGESEEAASSDAGSTT